MKFFAKLRGRGLGVYLALVFALTYLYEILLLPGLLGTAGGTVFVSLAMLLPTLAMLLTRLLTVEGFAHMNLAPHFRGHLRWYAAAWLLPMAAILLGAAAYFALFPAQFDPGLSLLRNTALVQGGPLPTWGTVFLQGAAAVAISPLLNLPLTLGEEWGWRGYMMPKLLARLPVLPACLVGGVIWGLWHAPLTVMGHNYGTGYPGYPFAGIFAMCCFCVAIGTFLTWLTVKTGSCLPAALAHAALNGEAQISVLFTDPAAQTSPFLGPLPTGILGGAGLIALAVFCALRLHGQKKEIAAAFTMPCQPQSSATIEEEPPHESDF